MLWGVVAGIGLTGLWAALSERIGGTPLKASPILLIAFAPLILNWHWADRAGDYAARDWAYDLLMSVEPYGVLFTGGDNDTFPLWYAQEVEGVRKDVTVIVTEYLGTDWYASQLRELTEPDAQRHFESEQSVGLYDPTPAIPSRAITTVTREEVAASGTVSLSGDVTLPLGPVAVVYPAGTVMGRPQQLALRIIADSICERPIYFASTGRLIRDLGLGDWGVRQGLATKLDMRRLADDPPGRFVTVAPDLGGEVVDVERSLALVDDVYTYRGLRDRPIWQDRSTVNIPMTFTWLMWQLADAVQREGRGEDIFDRLVGMASAFQVSVRGGTRLVSD